MNSDQPPKNQRYLRILLANSIAGVVLLFMSVPILFLLYGGAAGAIGGIAILGLFAFV